MNLQDYLTGHPIFAFQNNFEFSLNLSFDKFSSSNKNKPSAKQHASAAPHRQSIMASTESDLLVAVGSEIRITSLLDARNAHSHERMYKTLYTPNVEFQIRQLALNANGKLLAIAGRTEVAVITLPKAGYHKLVPSKLDCRTVQIGQFYHATRSSSPVVKIEWHPWGRHHCTLLVMTADGILREYDISIDPEEPRQVLSFMPERSYHSSFKGDSSSREVVSFCIGGGKADWGPLTIYALSKSGDVWAICPYIPHNAMIPSSYIHALDYFVRAKQENVLQMSKKGYLDSNSFSVMYAQQLKYVSSIMKQLSDEHSSLFPLSEKSIPITAPGMTNLPTRQGPFLLQPSPVEFNEGDGGNATDIFYLYSTLDSPPFSDENEKNEIEEGLGVILMAYSDGRVDICLDVEKVEATWESSSSAPTSLPALAVYETIDLGLLSLIKNQGWSPVGNETNSENEQLLRLLKTNWPTMTTDPIYHDTMFIYHSFGVHSLNLTPWIQPLIKAMRTGIDEHIESVVKKGLVSDVTSLLETSLMGPIRSDPIFGVVLPSDIYLSYCLVAITQSFIPHTTELSFRLRDDEEIADNNKRQNSDLPSLDAILEMVPGPQTKDLSVVSLLSQEPYSLPAVVSLPETIEAIKKLGRPLPDIMKRNIIITPEMLREFATIIQRFQSYIRDIYMAVNNFQDRMILQDQEFQRQQTKYMEIVERVKKLKEEDNIRLKQRFERCLSEQKRLLTISDKVLQKFMDANSPTLSEQEKKWFAELQRMKMEILGETSYDSSSIRARTDTLSHKLEYHLPKLRDFALKEEQRKKELNNQPVELGKAQEYQILMRLGEQKQILSATISRLQEMAQKLNIEVENVPDL